MLIRCDLSFMYFITRVQLYVMIENVFFLSHNVYTLDYIKSTFTVLLPEVFFSFIFYKEISQKERSKTKQLRDGEVSYS